MGPRRVLALVTAAAALAAAAPATAAVTAERRAVYALAGDCRSLAPDEPVSFKATGLGTFLLTDGAGRLVGVGPGDTVGPIGGPAAAGPTAEWAATRVAGGRFTLRSTSARRGLVVGAGGSLSLGGSATPLALQPARGCATFPEAGLDATGRAPRATNRDGTIHGFADTHLHITADMRAGGSVISGAPFDRFGIVRALGGDAAVHGADGSLDATGNLLRSGVPFGTHETTGWPTFAGWPTHDTNTHQQVYFRWLQRAWLAGLRLVVAETVEDTIICRIEPRRRFGCDETAAVRRQVRALHALQDYVDAQAGGPGRGWFRLVTSPAAARRAMERGKLAVVIGVESSFPLGCRAERGHRCTAAQVDRRLAALQRLGVRSLFVAHWADNGFAGAAIEGGVKGKFINAMQRIETGHWFGVARCPHPGQGEELQPITPLEVQVVGQFFPAAKVLENAKPPTYPAGRRCNERGLTALGRHLVERMLATGMLVELDHMSERARDQVLAILRRAHRPGISGHNGTGGAWTTGELRTLTALGGVASQTPEPAADLARAIAARERYRARDRFFGVGLGTDTGGFATLPGPAADAATDPLRYPFRVEPGGVVFERQRTGERTFDLNADGVAHYGLLPDLLADMERRPQGRRATKLLFRSAEAYLRMWERAVRRR